MNRIDHAVIGGLVLLLGVIAVAIGAPAFVPAAAHPTPPPAPAEVAPYREGVLGPVVSVNPLGARTQADRDLVALVFEGLVARGPDGMLVPGARDPLDRRPDRQDLDVQPPARRPLARRRAGHGRRRRLHDPDAPATRPTPARAPARGRRSPRPRSTRGRSGSISPRRSAASSSSRPSRSPRPISSATCRSTGSPTTRSAGRRSARARSS